MGSISLRSRMYWIDGQGGAMAPSVGIAATGDGALLAQDCAKLTNATLSAVSEIQYESYNQIAISPSATYLDVTDVAVLQFQTTRADGSHGNVRLLIPAPRANIFLSDGVTVAVGQLGSLVTDMEHNAVDSSLAPVTGYTRGWRSWMAIRRY